jgi:hypothetical protein
MIITVRFWLKLLHQASSRREAKVHGFSSGIPLVFDCIG